MLNQEILQINKTFQAHKVAAIALPVHPKTGKQLLTLTPSFALVPIIRSPATRIASVASLLPELRAAVYSVRGTDAQIRFSNAICSHLEIPRQDPKLLLWSDKSAASLSPHSAMIGKSYGVGVKLESIDLTDSNQGSVFVSGISGGGKSTAMRAFLASVMLSTSPSKLHVYLVDLKQRSFVPFENCPHVMSCAYTGRAADQTIRTVYAEMMARKKAPQPYRILLAVDELRELKFVDPALLEMLSRIASLGRELGVHLLAATQKPLSSELGSILKSQFAIRLVGRLEDANSSQHVTGRAGLNAHLLEGKGSMLRVGADSEPVRMQCFYLSDDDAVGLAGQISSRWGSVNVSSPKIEPVAARIEPVAEIIEDEIPVSREELDAQKILKAFDELYVDGSFLNGAKTKLAKLILGSEATYAGGSARRVDKAIQYVIRNRSAIA